MQPIGATDPLAAAVLLQLAQNQAAVGPYAGVPLMGAPGVPGVDVAPIAAMPIGNYQMQAPSAQARTQPAPKAPATQQEAAAPAPNLFEMIGRLLFGGPAAVMGGTTTLDENIYTGK